MNFDCGIYSITSPSGKQYIGQAKSFKRRWWEHLYRLRDGKHHCKGLQNAFSKYGEDALVFSKIAIVPVEQLDAREQEQIDSRARRMLYNVALFAAAPARGRKMCEATRVAIMLANVGRTKTPEERAKLAAANTGKKFSDAHRAALSEVRKKQSQETRDKNSLSQKARLEIHPHIRLGAILTADTKAKISEAHRGKILSEEHRAAISAGQRGKPRINSRAILCVDLDMRFPTIAAAKYWLHENGWPNAGTTSLCAACSGKQRIAYGYRWSYLDTHNGEERYWLTTPVKLVMLETAFCAAAPTATDAFDQIEVPATVGAVTCAPEASFPINAEYA